jgi:hypothetical protein
LASAYTPGLTVSGDIVVRRIRRLPIKGEVLVEEGQPVEPDSIVARALLPGVLQTIKFSERLGVEAKDAKHFLKPNIGDPIEKGQVLAETSGFFGLFKNTVVADYAGTIEEVSEITGNVLVREAPTPVDIKAYIKGKIAETVPEEGAVVETRCALVQGIFGVGGERTGIIRIAVSGPDAVLQPNDVLDDDAGKILVAGSGFTYEALQRASQVGAAGILAGGLKDGDLVRFLGYDIGVAITGQEAINLTLVITEGFGYLAMAERTFKLLQTLEGQEASLNGATQIRAGVIRPEAIVPISMDTEHAPAAVEAHELKIGTQIRIIREPYFGELGSVTELPAQLVTLESGTEVRVLRAKLTDGRDVTVPRANVEIMASA